MNVKSKSMNYTQNSLKHKRILEFSLVQNIIVLLIS